ncbi:hypothetical protein Taro_056519 [Colocasia esculenta]|uniref:Uncharacterized protein n=1 Tax=Colocasia esculenta TaxID=4460 RepID=A0A843XXL4_COLES|nr:hypothetical protein [Colocasia esculenta]
MAVPKKGTHAPLAHPCRVMLVGSECELQECVAAVAGCACFEHGCWFARVAFGFVVGLHAHVGVSQRLREPMCGVGFTGAGLWFAVPVEVCVVLAVCLALCACAPLCAMLCSVGIFARAKQMLVCRVAPLVEHCDTWLWLLSALCWLVVNSGEVLPEFFSVGSGGGKNDALVVLVEVLLEPVCVASTVCYVLFVGRVFGRLFGLRSGDVFPERLLVLWVEVLPKLPCVVFVCRCSLSVEMNCRRCRLDCLCDSLFGRCRSRCCALGHVSGRGAGQVVFLSIFEFSQLCWWDFVCPHGRKVGFVSCALWTLPDGSLVSAMGVWLVVLLWKCQSHLVISPCVWKRLIVRVLLPCFPLVARGGGAFTWHLVPCRTPWRPLWRRSLPLCCLEVELVAPLVCVVFLVVR